MSKALDSTVFVLASNDGKGKLLFIGDDGFNAWRTPEGVWSRGMPADIGTMEELWTDFSLIKRAEASAAEKDARSSLAD